MPAEAAKRIREKHQFTATILAFALIPFSGFAVDISSFHATDGAVASCQQYPGAIHDNHFPDKLWHFPIVHREPAG